MPGRPAEAAASRPETPQERLFTPNFLLTSLVTLASFSGFYFLLATLPVYVMQEAKGSASDVGLVMGAFSTVAVLLKPFVGKASDIHGKRPYILLGTALLTLCSGLYTLARTLPLLLALRLLHGAAWASFGTATSALVADVAPLRRRGAAMGYYGMFINLAMAAGPALGFMLLNSYGFPVLFAAAAGTTALAVLLTLPITEPPRAAAGSGAPAAARGEADRSAAVPPVPGPSAQLGGLLEPSALFPSAVLALSAMTYGSIVSFLPIYAAQHGVDNPGVFFTAFAVTLIASRGFTGHLSDRHGRAAVIAPGLALAAAAVWVLAFATSLPTLLAVAVLYGLAFAAVQPTMMALVVDRAPPGRRGAAMGTFSSAMDLGIGLGSVTWGFVAQSYGFGSMYLASGSVALLALAVFLFGTRGQRSTRPAR